MCVSRARYLAVGKHPQRSARSEERSHPPQSTDMPVFHLEEQLRELLAVLEERLPLPGLKA